MTEKRQGSNGMPRLSHADAEQLISARLDSPLPAEQNRILLAHLAICPSCRAFAGQVELMTQGLRSLPMFPASPTVSRQVRERIAEGQSSWSRFSRVMVNGRWGAMPAMASALVLVAAVAFSIIFRGNDDPGSTRTPIAAASSTDIALNSDASPSPTLTKTDPTAVSATNTPYVIRRDDNKPTPPNVQVLVTETVEPSVTPQPSDTPTPTETATSTSTPTPSYTATVEKTATEKPKPTATATENPSATAEPTETATEAPTRTALPSETATNTPSDTPAPTETATDKPTEIPPPTGTPVPPTDTPRPTRTATDEPTKTLTPVPTKTETPAPTATATAQPTDTPTTRPTKTATDTPTETETPTPTNTRTPRPTKTPEPTEMPTEQTQPRIVQVGGGNPTQESVNPTSEPDNTALVIEYETPTETVSETVVEITPEPNSRIQPTGGSTEAAVETPTEEVVSTPEVANIDGTGRSGGGVLAEAETLGRIGSGFFAPAGGLRMPVDLEYAVVTGPDGALTVVDAQGNLIQSLGAATYPVWSPKGQVLLFESLAGESPKVFSWDREDGQTYEIGAASDVAVADTLAGWVGAHIYYLRSFPDAPGSVELHRSDWNGDNDELLWTAEGIDLAGERPVATLDGVLIPTVLSWIFVDIDGIGSELAAPAGYVGEPLLSPFGSLIAYVVGDQLIIAPTVDPGTPHIVIPYPDGISGFDFSPDGTQIVVSDGTALLIYSSDNGSLVAGASDGTAVGYPHWSDDGIRFLELGDPTTLKLVQPGDFEPAS